MFKTFVSATLLSMLSFSVQASSFILNTGKQQIQLQQQPKTIAVYDLAVLDTLNALGIEAQVIPKSSYNGALSKYQDERFIKAGSLFEPDTELLKQQKPELIFVGGRSAKAATSLNSIAPTIELGASTGHYMDDLRERTMTLAKSFNRTDVAEQKLKKVKTLQQQLQQKTQGKSAIMLFHAGENFIPHAQNDRFGYAYELTGFSSVLPLSQKSEGPRPEAGSPEAKAAADKNAKILQDAIAKQPDYLIVLDRGAVNTGKYTAPENIKKHPVLSQAKAVKANQVIYVNADAWYLVGAGLDNSIAVLEELNKAVK